MIRSNTRLQPAERSVVFGLFCLFVLHLLLYVWLVPPWQHYDEPTHFEYALLIRDLGRLPTLDEEIPELRRTIARSMIDSGFFRNQTVPLAAPDLTAPDLSLGINERGHPPLYYAIVALGTLPFRHLPINSQLYAARCVSVALAALLFWAAYWLLRLVTGKRWGLRCAVLAVLALQPTFVDNSSSVNNDVLANLVAVLLLLVAVAVALQTTAGELRGQHDHEASDGQIGLATWQLAIGSLLVIALAWNTKRTLLVYSLLVPLAWLLRAPRIVRRAMLGLAGLVAAVGVAWLALVPWPLADWQGSNAALIARPADSVAGRSAFVVGSGEMLTQRIYPYRIQATSGEPLTLTVWMRADTLLHTTSPLLMIGTQVYSQPVTLGPTWQMVTITAPFGDTNQAVWIQLHGGLNGTAVSYDSLALVAGAGPTPSEDAPDGAIEAGAIGTITPRNMARNGGAERHIPPLPTPVYNLVAQRLGAEELGQILSSISNLQWITLVYPRQFWLLFIGSWGIFGWGQYSVSAGWFTPLALLAAASTVGTCLLLLRQAEHDSRRRAWWLCLLAVGLGWGVAMLRVHNQPFPGAMFWSFGRYTFVALLPSLLLFVAGFRAIFPTSLRNQATAAQLGFVAVFALVAASGW